MQVYIAVIDGKGNFLLARKKVYGTFFKGAKIKGKSPPYQVLNGAGQYVFSGGALEDDEKSVDGALREFREETGIALGAHGEAVKVLELEDGDKNKFCLVVWTVGETKALEELALAVNGNLAKAAVDDDELAGVRVEAIAKATDFLGVAVALSKTDSENVAGYRDGTGPYKGRKPKPYSQGIGWYALMAAALQNLKD